MARSRNIKPGLFKNEVLGVADPLYTLLFEGLWVLADRAGRLEDRPLRIKGEVFPYRDGIDMEAMLGWLQSENFIVRYVVDGKRFIQILNFAKHQSPHKNEAPSEIPEHSGACTEKIGTHAESIGCTRADSLNLIPDSLNSDCRTSALAPTAADAAPKQKRGTRLDTDWVLPRAWGVWALEKYPHFTEAIIRLEAEKFSNHFRAKTGKGSTSLDWSASWRTWVMSDICQRAHPPPGVGKETPYASHMRQRVEEAAGSMAHIVAAKPPGQRPLEPWEVAANEQRTIEAQTTRPLALGMD